MLDKAHDLHYETFTDVLDARDYGVPQSRRRQFIVGSPVGRVFRFPAPRTRGPSLFEMPSAICPRVGSFADGDTGIYREAKGPYQQLMRSRVNPDESALIRDHIVRPVRNDDRDIFLAMKPGDRYIDIDPAYQRYSTASFADKYYKLLPDALASRLPRTKSPCATTARWRRDACTVVNKGNAIHCRFGEGDG
jgi:DNA (cytosine-5)-methyltransferase 1